MISDDFPNHVAIEMLKVQDPDVESSSNRNISLKEYVSRVDY